ncbi:MAG: hypothetical protein LBI02_04440 [Opitutaceae bacterium]|jgi:hypothetical protein|nr:hypothetical protein [Opitutaceae bacterium]
MNDFAKHVLAAAFAAFAAASAFAVSAIAAASALVAGLPGARVVRDLWRQRDLGLFEDGFSAGVPRHGVVLVRLYKPGKTRDENKQGK